MGKFVSGSGAIPALTTAFPGSSQSLTRLKKSTSTPTVDKPRIRSETEIQQEEDQADQLLRAQEKRRKGRRSTILANIGEEEAQLGPVGRPTAGGGTGNVGANTGTTRSAKVVLG